MVPIIWLWHCKVNIVELGISWEPLLSVCDGAERIVLVYTSELLRECNSTSD